MRPDEELCWWSAARVARAIARRELSAREYLRTLLARIERHNAALGLVVTLDERAFEAATVADEAVVHGAELPPLHGVAMTVKDALATGGLRTTGGETELATYVPREDAVAVAGARRAGAIVFGKTNLPAGSGDLQAYNDLFGVARNPWHPGFTTGGSSGGAAGAVAAGFTPLELGSDVAGSLRVPAAHCGVFAHKPSFGAVSMFGHVPPAPYKPTVPDISVIGPFARDVDDLEILLDVICGPHPWDRQAWQLSLPPARPVRRVAAWFDDPYCPVDEEVRASLEYAANLLAASGVELRPAAPPGIKLETSDQIFRRLLAAVAVNDVTAEQAERIAAGQAPAPAQLGGEFVAQRYRDWMEADERRTRLRMRWQAFFSRYDAILLPVVANLATAHDHRPFAERTVAVNGRQRPYWEQTVWAGLTGMAYLPSTVVPVRRDSRGLPIGIAIAGPYLGDRTTLAAARLLADVLPRLGHPTLPGAGSTGGTRSELSETQGALHP